MNVMIVEMLTRKKNALSALMALQSMSGLAGV